MKIGNIEVKVIKGNLTDQDSDVLVVPEFTDCVSQGGVGGAVYRAGMSKGMDEYGRYVLGSPLAYGDVLFTKSGRTDTLLAHVVTVGAKKDEQFFVVFNATLNMLLKGYEIGARTYAIPELGSGVIGYLTQEQSARAVFCAVQKFTELKPKNDILSVNFVVFGGTCGPAEGVLTSGSYKTFECEPGQKAFSLHEFCSELGLL